MASAYCSPEQDKPLMADVTEPGVTQVHQFLGVRDVGTVNCGNRELLPEGLPVQDVTIKHWDIDLG